MSTGERHKPCCLFRVVLVGILTSAVTLLMWTEFDYIRTFCVVTGNTCTCISTLSPPTTTHLAGGNGYINDYPTGRLLRDAKLYEIGAGTSEIRRLVIGRAFNALFKE